MAVVVSRFPKVTETFILREIQELERQGQPVRLVPLLHQRDSVVHPEALPWVGRALYTPFLSAPILRENLEAFRESPGHYLRVLLRTLVGSLSSPNLLRGTLAIFPKAVYLGRTLRREGAGHVHGHFATHPAMAAYIASEFGGLPWSFTAHAHDIFLPGSRAMLGDKIRRASFVRVISEYNRRFLEERYPAGADGRILVIPMGIDPGRYAPGRPDPGRVLCVASLQPYKGIPTLVEACGRSPLRDRDFELCIVGDGPQRREVEDRIRRLGLEERVRLLGSRTQDEVADLLDSAAVFVHPSTVTRRGWMDGIPVALMEAMASHVPVVTTWVSGIPELVEDGKEGILVFPDDPGALAEALAALLDDPDGAREMGEGGRRKVERGFRLERCVSSLIEALDFHVAPISRDVGEALRPGLQGVAAGALGDVPDAMGIRRLHRGPDSMVAELTVRAPKGDQEVAVKVHRERVGASRPSGERARKEFEILRQLHDRSVFSQDDPVPVPRPLALFAPDGTVVMEGVRGTPLDVRLRQWREGRDDDDAVLSAIRAAGRWLWRFHEQTGEEAEPPAREALDHLLRRASADLARTRRWLSSGLEASVRSSLRAWETNGPSTTIRATGTHCDFWPGNVLVDGSGLAVIDFEGYRLGLPGEDVAYFLVHLELCLSRPWHRHRWASARQAFLEGYGLADPARLDLCSATTALQLLARAREMPDPVPPRGWWRRRLLKGMLRRSVARPPDRRDPGGPGPSGAAAPEGRSAEPVR